MRFHTVLFDLDGTLTDPAEGITNSFAHALYKMGVPVPPKSSLLKYIGPPLMDSFAIDYGFSEEESRTALRFYREYFADRGIFENEVYEGISEVLSTLKKAGLRVGLATSKLEPYAIRILEHFKLRSYFDYVAGSTIDEQRTKKAEVITYALSSLGIPAERGVAMVGDREYDMRGAKETGVTPIGVLYGYGSREELNAAGAEALAERVTDLLPILLQK